MTKKQTNKLTNLIAQAKEAELKEKTFVENAPENKGEQTDNTDTPEQELKEKKIEAVPELPANKEDLKFEDFFNNNSEYGVGDLNLKIPICLHKEFKLLSAHSGVPMTKIISNILDDFLKKNKKEITKLMKR
jgi:hypothetical protein